MAQLARVLKAVRRQDPEAESEFVTWCRAYGKCTAAEMHERARDFIGFLSERFGAEFAVALTPELVQLLPDPAKASVLANVAATLEVQAMKVGISAQPSQSQPKPKTKTRVCTTPCTSAVHPGRASSCLR